MDCSAGVHPRFSKYYLSNISVPTGTPMCDFLKASGVPIRCTLPASVVFAFPLSSPEGSRTADVLTAVEQLDIWKLVNDNWCDHNASCTIYVGDNEWPLVEEWIRENPAIAGVTFMSRFEATGGTYMPLEKLTEQEYNEYLEVFPKVDWSLYKHYDNLVDNASREFACTGGACELLT